MVDNAPTEQAFAGNNLYTCGADTLILNALLPSTGAGVWSSNSPFSCGDSSQAATWVTGWNQDTTVLYWSLSAGRCRNYSIDSLLIIDNQVSMLAQPDGFDLVADQPTTIEVLQNDQGTDNGQVFIRSGLPNGQLVNQGNGWFEVTAASGDSLQYFVYDWCSIECPDICDTALVTLHIDALGACKVPNIFTPNDDGVNDVFEIPCLTIRTEAYLTVFNRWGDQVYETDRYNNQWDGRHAGQPLPDGTYFYILRIPNQRPVQGSVEIRR
jgi:gliding motility-associated-like protein